MNRARALCFISYLSVLALAPGLARAELLASQQLSRDGQTFFLMAFGPGPARQPATAPLEQAAMRLGMSGLIEQYIANKVIGPKDQQMIGALKGAAEERNALSLVVFKSTVQPDGAIVAGKMVAMVRAFLPDKQGALGLEQKIHPLRSALRSAGEHRRPKVEIGNLFVDKREPLWIQDHVMGQVAAQFKRVIHKDTTVLLQTSQGARERLYRAFYGFATVMAYDDPLIGRSDPGAPGTGSRVSVVMKTSGERFLARVRRSFSGEERPRIRPMSLRRTGRLFKVGRPTISGRRRP